MATTLREIAKRSGVSMQTVSGVLNDKAHLYRPQTRSRVLEAAEALGYRPNGSAKAMRSGKFGSVALLESTNTDLSYKLAGLIGGLQQGLAKHGLQLVLGAFPDEKLTDSGYVPRILRELSADGLLINYTNRIPTRMIELIERFSIPAIWLNVPRPSDSVYFDDFNGSCTATAELLARGHRRIAYVDYHNVADAPDAHYSVAARRDGYLQTMRQPGLSPQLILSDRQLQPAERAELASKWIRNADCPTAIVAYSPYTATGVFLAAVANGRVVPRDLSIITFAEPSFLDTGMPISAMVLPETQMGAAAAEQLVVKLQSAGEPLPPQVLPLTFSAGHNLATPRKAD